MITILYITTSFTVAVTESQISIVREACRILLTFLVGKLPQQSSQLQKNNSVPVLTRKQLLLPVRALCVGQSLLAKSEEITLIEMMKNAKIPQSEKSSLTSKGEESAPQTRETCDSFGSELEQLTIPLQDLTITNDIPVDDSNKSESEIVTIKQQTDLKVSFKVS